MMAWFLLLPRLRFSEEDERLFFAARHGDVASLERSLDAGAKVNAAAPIDGKSALFRAAVFGHTDAVRFLLKRGADPAKRGADGLTALEIVTAAIAEERDRSVVQSLNAVAADLRKAESKP